MDRTLNIIGISVAFAMLLIGMAYAGSAQQLKMVGSQWAVYEQNTLPNGNLHFYPADHATTTSTGVEFSMPDATASSPTYVNYLLDTYRTPLTESNTINAAISVDASPTTIFVGNPDGGNSATSFVRLFIQSNLPASNTPTCAGSGYNEYNYWWSNPTAYSFGTSHLDGLVTLPVVLSVPLNPADWSDLCGHFANKNATTGAAFDAAIAKLKDVGLSFGSGSFFANGAGIDGTTGSAVFQLQSYQIT